jgi:hypothetical protein
MRTVQRTDDAILKIIMSFLGSYENLILLEDGIQRKEKITLPQYANYLSQIALCIELGMKSILINETDIYKTHDLKELYGKMPSAFRDMFEKRSYPKKTIDKSLEKVKTIFEDFRYVNIENIAFFLDKSVFDTDYHIVVSQVMRLQNFQFIIILLDEIKKFHRFLNEYVNKDVFKKIGKKRFTFTFDTKHLDNALSKYHDELKNIQSNSYIEKYHN